MKGIILAGGAGSRLYPLTSVVTKQLQPVYDKPMIYYPLSVLMLGGVKEILIITMTKDLPLFQSLLGTGEKWGITIEYKIQDDPNGIPEAFKLGADFLGDDDVTLILGDNLFYGDFSFYRNAIKGHLSMKGERGYVFTYQVSDPERYGVVEFDRDSQKVLSIEEKPKEPRSNFAIPGLYIFDNSVVKKAFDLKPSARGETEIVDIIKNYLELEKLWVSPINRGIAWLDTGTPKSLMEASSFIEAIEARQGLKVACLEEIALRMKFITMDQYLKMIESLPNCSYRDYLKSISQEFQSEK